MEIEKLSSKLEVRSLGEEDIEKIYDLCRKNKIFYQYHLSELTRESIKEDMEELPPGTDKKDKYYVGFFKDEVLAAIMDFVLDYPRERIVFVGLFMMNRMLQGKGVGTEIIGDFSHALSELGMEKIRLAVDKGNMQSFSFWSKNHFEKTGEEVTSGIFSYLLMERRL